MRPLARGKAPVSSDGIIDIPPDGALSSIKRGNYQSILKSEKKSRPPRADAKAFQGIAQGERNPSSGAKRPTKPAPSAKRLCPEESKEIPELPRSESPVTLLPGNSDEARRHRVATNERDFQTPPSPPLPAPTPGIRRRPTLGI
ncbi:hypothetical protein KM043_002772 [Ampulex compressa]|nr:hypothetical protein KM043_002772 [Ampulex compressa]